MGKWFNLSLWQLSLLHIVSLICQINIFFSTFNGAWNKSQCENKMVLLPKGSGSAVLRQRTNGKPLSFSNHLVNSLSKIFTSNRLASLSTFVVIVSSVIFTHKVCTVYVAHSAINFHWALPSVCRKRMMLRISPTRWTMLRGLQLSSNWCIWLDSRRRNDGGAVRERNVQIRFLPFGLLVGSAFGSWKKYFLYYIIKWLSIYIIFEFVRF